MKLVYLAVFAPLEEQEGYCVQFPDLPGCITQGKSLSDAIDMAIDAASGWILDEIEDGNDPPRPQHTSHSLNLSEGEFTSLISLDIDGYAEKHGQKAVRKNCTIPAWLNSVAERNNINFSETLQKALINDLHINQ